MKEVTRQERGWAGHFICAKDCLFRRNTLLTCGDARIVVSTVGLMLNALKGKGAGFEEDFSEIGYKRYYETMAFHSNSADTKYHDIDVTREIRIDSNASINVIDADVEANEMHEQVVEELTQKLANGEMKE